MMNIISIKIECKKQNITMKMKQKYFYYPL